MNNLKETNHTVTWKRKHYAEPLVQLPYSSLDQHEQVRITSEFFKLDRHVGAAARLCIYERRTAGLNFLPELLGDVQLDVCRKVLKCTTKLQLISAWACENMWRNSSAVD
jgi:hypothetical protein